MHYGLWGEVLDSDFLVYLYCTVKYDEIYIIFCHVQKSVKNTIRYEYHSYRATQKNSDVLVAMAGNG